MIEDAAAEKGEGSSGTPSGNAPESSEVRGRGSTGTVLLLMLVVLLVPTGAYLFGNIFWRSAATFLQEASVLVAVFAILDRHLQDKGVTGRYVAGVMLVGIGMLLVGDIVESRLQAADAPKANAPDATAPSTQTAPM